ncbi:MAG: hypothetical protein QOF70_6103 [Acetobacteraceae bacterium]|nr:hypothetical protein [Acetobacteraceae bacterium]
MGAKRTSSLVVPALHRRGLVCPNYEHTLLRDTLRAFCAGHSRGNRVKGSKARALPGIRPGWVWAETQHLLLFTRTP